MKDIKEEKKETILEVAKRLFARYGFSKTTLDDIGEAVGMKKNSLYHYFANKEELFNEIIAREARKHFEYTRKALAEDTTASGKLMSLFGRCIKAGRENENLYNVSVSAKLEIINMVENSFAQFINEMVEIVSGILKEGINNDEFILHDYEHLAKDLIVMSTSIEYREHQKSRAEFVHELDYDEIDRKVLNLLKYIIRGISVTPKD